MSELLPANPPVSSTRSWLVLILSAAIAVVWAPRLSAAEDRLGPNPEIIATCTKKPPLEQIEPWMAQAASPLPERNASIDVTTLGAQPDDDVDDSAALEKIPAGSTARFPPGIFLVSRPIRLRSGTTYTGSGTLKRALPGAGFVMIGSSVEDVAVSGLTFDGGGIVLGGARKIRLERNRFIDIVDRKAPFGRETGVFIEGTLADSSIIGNYFARIGFAAGKKTTPHGAGIQAYHLQNVTIAANYFVDVHQAISVILEARKRTGAGLRVIDNVVVNPLRMGIEVWGKAMTNALVEGNCVRAIRMGDQDIALSIVADGEGTIIRRNMAIQVQPVRNACAGMGIEVAGRRATVEGNYIAGHWCSAIVTYNEKSWAASITGNRACGHRSEYDVISFIGGIGASRAEENDVLEDCPGSLIVPID